MEGIDICWAEEAEGLVIILDVQSRQSESQALRFGLALT